MKKIMKFICLLTSTFVISACGLHGGISDDTPSHTHVAGTPVEENRIEPTCTKDGSYDLVVYCVDDHTELSRDHRIIPALGHDLIHHGGKEPTCVDIGYAPYDTCSRCDYSTYVEIAATGHNPGSAVTENLVEATCTDQGSYDLVVYCQTDGIELSREHHIIPALGHDFIHHDGKDATCTENGYKAYDTCSRCDYSNYETIAATGHSAGTPVEENRIEPTCTKDGSYDLVVYCQVDGVELSRETFTISATGHLNTTKLKKNIIEATCTEPGSYDYVEYCNVCGEKIGEEHVVTQALGHHLIHHHGKESTCLEQGYDDYYECDRCDYSTKILKDLLSHVEGNTIVDNIIASTDETTGSFDLVTFCSVGGEELSRQSYEIGNSEHIKLTKNSASIFEQDYYRFYVDNDSDIKNVSWSVSNEDVLTINSNGKLASYGPGESIVFATAESGEFASAYLEIKEDIIDISAPENAYYPGSSFSMIITENSRGDNKFITWSSSDESVATVSSSGLVNVLASGEVIIRAELPSGKYDECVIVFGQHYLILSSSSHTMYRNETYNLLSGCSAPSTVTWTSSNSSIATVSSSGIVTAKAVGSTTITASSNLCGTKTCVITVTSSSVSLSSSNYSSYLTYSYTSSYIKPSNPFDTGWKITITVSLKSTWVVSEFVTIKYHLPFYGMNGQTGYQIIQQGIAVGSRTTTTTYDLYYWFTSGSSSPKPYGLTIDYISGSIER